MSEKVIVKDKPSDILYIKPKRRIKPSRIIGMLFVIGLGMVMVYPLIWMFMSSFKETHTILATANSLWPETWTWENYAIGWQGFARSTFGTFFKNSFIIAGVSTVGTLMSCSLVAYSFSRGMYRGRKLLFVLMLGTLMLPANVLMVPQFIWFRQLDLIFEGVSWINWMGTHLPLIVPSFFAVGGFFIYLMTNFMNGIPKELDEAAKIDGCSFYGIFGRIILPLSVPTLITAAIFNFMWRWDDFMGPLIYLRNPATYPASLALRGFTDAQTSATPFGPIFAMSVLSLLPLFLIFFLLQRYLVEGISTTGLKG